MDIYTKMVNEDSAGLKDSILRVSYPTSVAHMFGEISFGGITFLDV